jgi:hypothetical protein
MGTEDFLTADYADYTDYFFWFLNLRNLSNLRFNSLLRRLHGESMVQKCGYLLRRR